MEWRGTALKNFVNSEFHLGALAALYGGIIFYCFLARLDHTTGWVGFAIAAIAIMQATARYFQNRLTGFWVAAFYACGFGIWASLLVQL